MTNNAGTRNGNPYITVLGTGSLVPGASTGMTISFKNPNSSFINFQPVVTVGVF